MYSVRLRDFWDNVRATYWFVPTLMTLFASCLSIDYVLGGSDNTQYLLQDKWYIFHPETIAETRTVLNTIADTSLGVIGVVFSITLVPLSITSTQYGSIVLRSFLRDRGTQFVLGAYSATTFYCLFLLMSLRNATDQTGQLSVTVAVYMLLASLLMLLYFFHHVADSLQASAVVEQVSRELEQVIEQSYPLERPLAPFDHQHAEEYDRMRQTVLSEGEVITSTREGYVRAIDYEQLIHIASKHKLILSIKCLPGDFVSRGDQLLVACPSPLNKHVRLIVNRAYMLGKNRTLFQDHRIRNLPPCHNCGSRPLPSNQRFEHTSVVPRPVRRSARNVG